MLEKVKKFGVIAIIAILFALFSFSIVDVVVEQPKYEDYCAEPVKAARPVQEGLSCPEFIEPTSEEIKACSANDGRIGYTYDATGCPESYQCDTCWGDYEEAGKQHRLIGFIITSIMGIIAVIVGLYSSSKKEVVEWIFSGFLIGGILSIAFGTMSYFQDMGRFVKPVVLLVEMALIIWIAIKTASKKK